MRKHSVTLSGHRTSIFIEDEFWGCLEKLATEKNVRIAQVIKNIDDKRLPGQSLASAVRLFILDHYMNNHP